MQKIGIKSEIFGNKDDVMTAINGLNLFTHNYCMNCKETDEKNDLVFNCDKCEFKSEDGKCLIKVFANNHLPKGRSLPSDFGSMSR